MRGALVLSLASAASALVGCGGPGAVVAAPVGAEPGARFDPPPETKTGVEPRAATPFLPSQSWHGAYTCAQGVTELWLRIVRVQDADVDAVFEFTHAPTGVNGSYRMHGEWDGKVVHFEAGDWMIRPDGYVTVDLEGGFTDPRTFRGRVHGPGCTTFVTKLR